MTNWGFLSGMRGLYAGPSKREAAREELATLKILSDEVKAERALEEENQLKVQKYNEQVKLFADSMLGPDRDKINEKARILGGQVKEILKANNGDFSKFLQNGGHEVMANYQTSIMNSPEATTYIENRKNMEKINQIILSGKGHLITQRDMESLRLYQENNGGKISYTGLMSEIEMPDPNMFDLGTDIPAEAILRNKSNYLAILGNYMLEYPNSGKPTEEDLRNYVNSRYKATGTSTAKADLAYRDEMLNLQKQKFGMELEQHELNKMKTIAEIRGMNAAAMGNSPDGSGDTEFEYNTIFQLLNSVSGLTAENFDGAFEQNKYFSSNPTWDYSAKSTNPSERGVFWDLTTYPGEHIFGAKYKPVNSYQMFSNHNPLHFAKHAFGLNDTQLDMDNRVINNFTPTDYMYWADGVSLKKRNVDLTEHSGSYTVKGIITGGTVLDKDGNRSMVMSADDAKRNSELKKDYGKSEVTPGLFMVMEDEDGRTIYAPLPTQDSKGLQYSQALFNDPKLASMNIKKTTVDLHTKDQRMDYNKQTAQQMENNFNSALSLIEMNPSIQTSISSESKVYSPMSNMSLRKDFVTSFYATMTAGLEGAQLEQGFQQAASGGYFGRFIAEAKALGYSDITRDLNSGKKDIEILEKLLMVASSSKGQSSKETVQFIQQWMSMYPSVTNAR